MNTKENGLVIVNLVAENFQRLKAISDAACDPHERKRAGLREPGRSVKNGRG